MREAARPSTDVDGGGRIRQPLARSWPVWPGEEMRKEGASGGRREEEIERMKETGGRKKGGREKRAAWSFSMAEKGENREK